MKDDYLKYRPAAPVALDRLRPWSAFTDTVWPNLDTPLKRSEIKEAVNNKLFTEVPLISVRHQLIRLDHVTRIAFFVVYGWRDPIEVDVGVPELGCHVKWPVMDGNHRVAAAFYREDPTIMASISGSLAYASELLGVFSSTPAPG